MSNYTLRNYETARTLFAFLEFVAWTAVVAGLVAAFAGASATTYYSSSSAGLLGAVPGIGLSLIGLTAAAVVQNSRAGVDSAEIAGKALRIAEEQLKIAKDQKKASYAAAATFAQQEKPAVAPSSKAPELATATADVQPANKAPYKPRPAPAEMVNYKGTAIRVTTGGAFIHDRMFVDLVAAQKHIDAKPLLGSR